MEKFDLNLLQLSLDRLTKLGNNLELVQGHRLRGLAGAIWVNGPLHYWLATL